MKWKLEWYLKEFCFISDRVYEDSLIDLFVILVHEQVCMKPGKIRAVLPSKLNDMPDNVIREFFESSYGRIIDFYRRKMFKKRKANYFTACWITFVDENASQNLIIQSFLT